MYPFPTNQGSQEPTDHHEAKSMLPIITNQQSPDQNDNEKDSHSSVQVIENNALSTLHNPNRNHVSSLFFHYPSCYGLIRWNEYTDNYNPILHFIPLENEMGSITDIPDLSGMIILNSCNGLLLCLGYNESEEIGGYHIVNPTTKKFETLPHTNLEWIEGLGLAYDPSRSHHYKVVSIWTALGFSSDTFQIEVYSSETKTWRVLGERFTSNTMRMYLSSGVYWNDSIIWFNGYEDPLYFNVEEERVGILPAPPILHDNFCYSHYYFGESGGHLHFVDFFGSPTQHNVYEMKGDYSEWFVKYQADLTVMVGEFPRMIENGPDYHGFYSVSSIIQGKDDEEGSFMVVYIPGKFIRYNFK